MPFNDNRSKNVTWDELLESISTGATHVDDTNWKIFYYLNQNYRSIGSVMSRTLLAAYIKLHIKRMSLVDSCMLGMAVKISEAYSDFNFPKFLEAWGYDSCLRAQDLRRQTGKDGRQYLSLKERVERALQLYMLHHPEENVGERDGIVSMYAVKMFEKEANGRRRRYIKLVSANGMEFVADSHLFPCRQYEICGRMFDVLTRVSKQGNNRASDIVLSQKRVEEVFSVEVGYVDGIDAGHGHIHIYDSQSRHFVADMNVFNALGGNHEVQIGSFVRFCPIIAQGDHFKSAAIVGVLDKNEGRRLFGIYEAKVEFGDIEKKYIRYSLVSAVRPTSEGLIAKSGFASTASLSADERMRMFPGSHIHIIMFLKRGADGNKRNYVPDIF